MDVAHTLIPATLENWLAPEYTDIFDKATVNFDEKAELAQVIALALQRRRDQLVIDALDASTPTETIGTNIGGSSSGLNMDKLRAVLSVFDDNGVPEEGRYIVASTRSKETI